MPAQEDPAQFCSAPFLLSGTVRGRHPSDRQLMLLLGNPPCLLSALGKVRKEEVPEDCEWKRDDSINKEEPAPWMGRTKMVSLSRPLKPSLTERVLCEKRRI